MNQSDALEIVQLAMWTVIVVASPAVVPAMVVGLVIALFQALTQIQEVTLTFIPKIMVIFISVALSAGFIGEQIGTLSTIVFNRIETGF
ncbi:MAG: flagellar biosynthesis protein FliQ [Notoacmeibacter sp.]|nr:flagellar biosynthesis protein FliQ [Notoacmeibacter sp.]